MNINMKKSCLFVLTSLFIGGLLIWQIYICIRLHFYVSCFVPTDSMSPTIVSGDYIGVSLLIPGRRVEVENVMGIFELRRKKGIRRVAKDDIVVFNYPYWGQEEKMIMTKNQYHCKRCVALPGDWYHWEIGNKKDSLFLPKVGSHLLIDSLNFSNYYRCIEYETGIKPIKKSDGIYHADTLLLNYEFQKDYYFMQGDNLMDSYDSRNWGVLPEDFIVGVAAFIWFSKDLQTDEIRWNRMFRCL